MKAAALALARRGIAVLPVWPPSGNRCMCGDPECGSSAKHPVGDLVPHGLYGATTDGPTISKWWGARPDLSIGIRTGVESGVVVVDIDPRNGGDVGFEQLEAEHGALPDSIRCKTGSGGRHVYLRHPGGDLRISSLKGIAVGVDLKADAGFVVAPPSLHISGRRYQWLDLGHSSLEPAPEWLVRRYGRPAWVDAQRIVEPFALDPETARALLRVRVIPEFRRRVLSGGERNANLVAVGRVCRSNRVPLEIAEEVVPELVDVCNRSPRTRRVPEAEARRAIRAAWKRAPGVPFLDVEDLLLKALRGRTFEGDARTAVMGFVADAVLRSRLSPRDIAVTLQRGDRQLCNPPLGGEALREIAIAAAQRADERRAAMARRGRAA